MPCVECGVFHEIIWGEIEWEPGRPETAALRCPACNALIYERFKAQMIDAGRWRATAPQVKSHAGFKVTALISLLPNASWGRLATEFLAARDDATSCSRLITRCSPRARTSGGDRRKHPAGARRRLLAKQYPARGFGHHHWHRPAARSRRNLNCRLYQDRRGVGLSAHGHLGFAGERRNHMA